MFFSAFLVEIVIGSFFVYRWGSTYILESVFGGDMVSHLYISRVVIDNPPYNTLANLGTVWLPGYHLLIMFFVWIDPFYATGFAETLVNALATGGICVIIYRLLGRSKTGVIAVTIFMANIFTLLFGATGVMEIPATFFLLLAVYYFKLYLEENDLAQFMKCSLALVIGTLTRYEMWFVAFIAVSIFTLREFKNRRLYRLAYAHFPFWGIIAWLFWNLAIFKDPLMFIHHPLISASTQSAVLFKKDIWYTSYLILKGLLTVSGSLLFVTSLAVMILLMRKRIVSLAVSALILSPILFLWLSYFTGLLGAFAGGITEIRFFSMGYPGLIIVPLLLVDGFKNKKIAGTSSRVVLGSVLLAVYLFSIPFTQATTLYVVTHSPRIPGMEEKEAICEIIGENTVLMSGTFPQGLSVIKGLPPSQIIDDFDGPFFLDAMEEPWKSASFVVIPISQQESSLIRLNKYYGGKYYIYHYYYDDAWRSVFLENYDLVLETIHFLVYQNVHLRSD